MKFGRRIFLSCRYSRMNSRVAGAVVSTTADAPPIGAAADGGGVLCLAGVGPGGGPRTELCGCALSSPSSSSMVSPSLSSFCSCARSRGADAACPCAITLPGPPIGSPAPGARVAPPARGRRPWSAAPPDVRSTALLVVPPCWLILRTVSRVPCQWRVPGCQAHFVRRQFQLATVSGLQDHLRLRLLPLRRCSPTWAG
jgi:hypothetical protein